MNRRITIEELEALATELEADTDAQRTRLARLCAAYHRILRQREPHLFQARATHHGDEAGHWDSSYPPKQRYTERTGPRSLKIYDLDYEDIATTGGFYYDWRRVTTYGGLCLGYDGRWIRGDENGTGSLGQFAAHPGDCSVDCTIEWSEVDIIDLAIDELTEAESVLRALAFPASVVSAAVS